MHPIDVHVGKRIRHRRWMVGMTQQQLAESIGIKLQQIQEYEAGATRVRASRLWNIAQALEVGVSFFFDGLEADSEYSAINLPNDLRDNFEARKLLRHFSAIPPELRSSLFDLIRARGHVS